MTTKLARILSLALLVPSLASAATRPLHAAAEPTTEKTEPHVGLHAEPANRQTAPGADAKVVAPASLRPAAKKVRVATKAIVKPAPAGDSAQAFVATKAAIESLRIVPFMRAMAAGQTVQGAGHSVNLAVLESAWSDKQFSVWIENEFRAERPADHEWIPSNYMLNVIKRAQSTSDAKWIDLQDQMRTATAQVIFKPSMASATRTANGKTFTVLEGHVGALDNATGGPLDVGQEQFHNELRAAFDASKTLADDVAGVRAVVQKWVWDGEAATGPIDPTITYHAGGSVASDPNLIAKAKANYAAINTMLDGIVAAVTATNDPSVAAR